MFDRWLRRYKDEWLRPLARRMSGFPPNAITLTALLTGLAAAGGAWAQWYRTALGLWLLNRLLDGLDGLVAREHARQTDFGGYLDIMADFMVYAALPLGLYLGAPLVDNASSLLALFATFYVNAASWMYLSAILEKRGAGAKARGEVTAVTMPSGLIGGTETIVFYSAFLIWPERMAPLFAFMACLVAVGVLQRLWWAQNNLSRPGRVLIVLVLLAAGGPAYAQAPPLEDFVALASREEKVAEAAGKRLAPVWKDTYAALVLDLARFFRPAHDVPPTGVDEDALGGGDDAQTGSAPRGASEPFRPVTRSPESLIRDRLMRFLAARTGKNFGNDLKRWRKWSWTLPYDPHSEYSAFKARLYANVDPRMASFFEAKVEPRIRLDEIDWGGVGVNGIPPLDQPKVVAAADAKYMGDKNVVFGMVINGEARAYPRRILAWHEMARDTLGGVKLAVVYCTLCGTVIPYETVSGGRSYTLGTSGLLYRSNKLMFDAETNSLWSTIEGRPVAGPLARSEIALAYRPVVTTTWREWRAAHPDTTVLSLDTGHQRDYDEGVAYRSYFSHDDLMFEVPGEDKRLKRKAEVVTFLAGTGGEVSPVALDVAFLRRNPVHLFSAGGARFVVLSTEGGANRVYRAGETRFVRASAREAFDDEGRGWAIGEDALTGPAGETKVREPARRTFWFAWFSQYPGTVLIR